jgi:shikimate kinase
MANEQPRLYLIGYRGSGKSTVGRALARLAKLPFFDADVELERAAGKTIRQIFLDDGEPAFRDLEAATLRQLSESAGAIIATGGGIVLREENRELLKSTGFIVWLDAPAEILAARILGDTTTAERRPNLSVGGREEIIELLARREPLYRECAHLRIDAADRSPDALAETILTAWTPSGSTSSG